MEFLVVASPVVLYKDWKMVIASWVWPVSLNAREEITMILGGIQLERSQNQLAGQVEQDFAALESFYRSEKRPNRKTQSEHCITSYVFPVFFANYNQEKARENLWSCAIISTLQFLQCKLTIHSASVTNIQFYFSYAKSFTKALSIAIRHQQINKDNKNLYTDYHRKP